MQHSEEPPKGLNNAFSTRPIERIRMSLYGGAPVSAATAHSTSGGVKQRRYALDKLIPLVPARKRRKTLHRQRSKS